MSFISNLKQHLRTPYHNFVKPFLYYRECCKVAPALAGATDRPVGWTRRHLFLDNLRHGATAEDYLAFEFQKKSESEKKRFMTTRRNWIYFTPKMVSPAAIKIFNNKDLFSEKFNDYMGREWIIAGSDNEKEWMEFISRHGKVIAKPADGCEGVGIFMIPAEDNDRINRLRKELAEGHTMVLEQLIRQHSEMDRLNPASVNTIRVETAIDRNGKTHITNTICIIGTGGDVINNAHNGGVMCHVDESTGKLSSWARNPKGKNLFVHPDNGIVFPGYQIPMWNEVLEFARKLSKVVPDARYIGWDIAITENGPVVIEGNTFPGHCTQACDMTGRWPLLKSMM